ncbi:MAG TPA: hypothetical protein VNA28_01515 [Solirubrobacteraceae bacterium]|nr:hypothetical protein [Solirubrobacteraceae bacterium]
MADEFRAIIFGPDEAALEALSSFAAAAQAEDTTRAVVWDDVACSSLLRTFATDYVLSAALPTDGPDRRVISTATAMNFVWHRHATAIRKRLAMTAKSRSLRLGLALAAIVAWLGASGDVPPPGPTMHVLPGRLPSRSWLAARSSTPTPPPRTPGCVTPERRRTPSRRRRRAGRDVPRECDGGTTIGGRVEVEFTNTATKERVSVRMEAGGTVIT